jgi:hypothetical protein
MHVCQHTDENEMACTNCHDPFPPMTFQERKLAKQIERPRVPLRFASRRNVAKLHPRTPRLLKQAMVANEPERTRAANETHAAFKRRDGSSGAPKPRQYSML